MGIPTQRIIPLTTRLGIILGGFKNQFGWFFLGFGMIFFWAFVMNADLSEFYFDENIISIEGTAIRWQETDAKEGEVIVYMNFFEFADINGNVHECVSYATGIQVEGGEKLIIEYPEGKPEYARIKGMRRQMFSPVVLFVVIFPLVGLIFLLLGIRRSFRALRLLKYGEISKGILISKERTNTKINGKTVYRLSFKYKDSIGKEYIRIERTTTPYNLEDQKEERLLYLRSKPSNAILVDNLPASAKLNENGNVESYPLRSVIFLMIFPLVTILGHLIYVLNYL